MTLRYGKIKCQHVGRVDLHRNSEYFPILQIQIKIEEQQLSFFNRARAGTAGPF